MSQFLEFLRYPSSAICKISITFWNLYCELSFFPKIHDLVGYQNCLHEVKAKRASEVHEEEKSPIGTTLCNHLFLCFFLF